MKPNRSIPVLIHPDVGQAVAPETWGGTSAAAG